jgi:hypothetical protein
MSARKSAIGAGFEAPEMEGKVYILTGQKPVQVEGVENLILLFIQTSKGALGSWATSKMEFFAGLSRIIVSFCRETPQNARHCCDLGLVPD